MKRSHMRDRMNTLGHGMRKAGLFFLFELEISRPLQEVFVKIAHGIGIAPQKLHLATARTDKLSMQNDRALPTPIPRKETHEKRGALIALPATPSFSLAEANSIVEIEVQADELLGYINKLTSLADRACSTAIRQSETAHLLQESRHGEINDLRKKLDQQNEKIHEQQIAIVRLQQESKAQIAALEVQLRCGNDQGHDESELDALRRENARLLKRLTDAEQPIATKPRAEPSGAGASLAEFSLHNVRRDETISTKTTALKSMETEFRAKISDLEQLLSEARAQSAKHEEQLRQKDAIIEATAAKEAEMGNLIKRLSAECAALSVELQKTPQLPAPSETKKSPNVNEGTIWRRVISRLQEEPQ